MKVQRLSSTDGFVIWDLEPAGTATGLVRLAPKVLQDGAALLARSVTYSFAAFGVSGHGGASAAINAKPEARDEALAAFLDEVGPLAEDGQLRLAPGLGITADDLAPLGWAEPDPALLARGAVAAGGAALTTHNNDNGLAGRTVAVVGSGPVAEAVSRAAQTAEAELADTRFDAQADVLFVGGKAGSLDHQTAETVQARVVVPISPVPVTARALAVLGRADCVVVPDFLSIAAPLLTTYDPEGDDGESGNAGDPAERIAAKVREVAGEGTGLWMAAALSAEDALASWTDEKPFGRPLA